MKLIKQILTILLIIQCQNGHAQGFINLDFESAQLSGYQAGVVPAADAIPGWTAYINGVPQTDIVYNELSLGAADVALFGAGYPLLDGAYSIGLYGGAISSTGVSISQTGLVPANASSIVFIAQGVVPSSAGGPLLVSLGGQNISYSPISTGPNYTTYGGNIPPGLVGLSEQLTFFAPTGNNNFWEIDDIQFSPSPVPEPNSFGLFALGGLFVAWRHCRKSAPSTC